jgi:CheY-like chemotaxis protein
MVRRERPGVLVVDGDAVNRRRITVLLGEAGIDVTAVASAATARTAATQNRFDLAVVGVSAELGASELGLAIVRFDRDQPRRFISHIREGLLGVEVAGVDEAELCIRAAKVACLDQRQHAARRAGAGELAAALAREIAETRALGTRRI